MDWEKINLSRRLATPVLWVALLGFLGLLLVSIVTDIDVVMRGVFLMPIHGFEAFKSLAFAVLIATSFVMVLLHGDNVTIRFLGKALGKRTSYWLEAFASVLVFVFFVIMEWQLVGFVVELREVNDTTMTVGLLTWPWWAISVAITGLCIPVQFFVMIGHFLRAVRGREPGGTLRRLDEEEGGSHVPN